MTQIGFYSLVVGTAWQGRAIDAGLLNDAIRRTGQAGISVSSPSHPLHLFLLMKDVAAASAARQKGHF